MRSPAGEATGHSNSAKAIDQLRPPAEEATDHSHSAKALDRLRSPAEEATDHSNSAKALDRLRSPVGAVIGREESNATSSQATPSASLRLEAHYKPLQFLLAVDHIAQTFGLGAFDQRTDKHPVLAVGRTHVGVVALRA